jgi:HEAT repeat protein
MEPGITPSIREIIDGLGDPNRRLLSSKLADLTNLDAGEMQALEEVWKTIESKRRRQIVNRLVELAEDNVELNFDAIFKSCLKDPDIEVRSKAIEGLWECEDTVLVSHFINLLEKDSSEEVQAAAALALGKFALLAEHRKLRPGYTSRVSEALLAAIENKSRPKEVRRRALEAAAPLSLPRVEKAILDAYHSPQPKFRVSAVYAMGKNCSKQWLPLLLKELASADAEIRYEAAGACGELGEEEATTQLAALINDPDVEVRMAAIQALGKIGGNKAKESLKQCLNNPIETVQQTAEQALHELMEDDLFTSGVWHS